MPSGSFPVKNEGFSSRTSPSRRSNPMRPPSQIASTDDDRFRMMFRAGMARKKRKERQAEGEIRELNIVAMMDMMTITPKNILVGDRAVVELIGGAIPRGQLRGRVVLPLDRALKKEVVKLKYIADRNPTAPFSHEMSVIGDRKIPYDLLLTVLYTAGRNELENYRFVVIQKDAD